MLQQALAWPKIWGLMLKLMDVHGGRTVLFRDSVRVAPGARVLDVGCGTGALIEHMPASVCYWGADKSWRYVGFGARAYGKRAKLVHCDLAQSWPFAEHSFDYVFAFGLLHHLSEAEALFVLRQAWTTMRESGLLVTVDPCRREGQGLVQKLLLGLDRGRHIRTLPQYRDLASSVFRSVSHAMRDDLLRLRYDLLVMRCQR